MDLYLNSLFPLILSHSDYHSRLALLATSPFFWKRRQDLLNVDNLAVEELVSLLRLAIAKRLIIRKELNHALSQHTFLCLVSCVNVNTRKQDEGTFLNLLRQPKKYHPYTFIIIHNDKFYLHPDFHDLHLSIHVTRLTKYCKVYHAADKDHPTRRLLHICSQGSRAAAIRGTLIKEKVPLNNVVATVIEWYYHAYTSSN